MHRTGREGTLNAHLVREVEERVCQLGGQVDGRRGQQDVLLQGAVVVLFAHQRQVVNELKRRE